MAYITTSGVTSNVNNWNFRDFHVEQHLTADEFVSAATTLICAGPPRLSGIAGSISDTAFRNIPGETTSSDQVFGLAFPIGVIANAGIQQNKQLQRVFEVGSLRSYFIPGRVMGGLSVNRIYYHGPSLMKALYYHRVNKATGSIATDIAQAGQDNFMMNLSSNLFNRPIGLLLMFKDSGNHNVAACYVEECYIQSHNFSITADSVIISEQVQIQFDRIVPVKLTGVGDVKVHDFSENDTSTDMNYGSSTGSGSSSGSGSGGGNTTYNPYAGGLNGLASN